MKNETICQSCGMPIDSEEIKGTEKMVQRIMTIANSVMMMVFSKIQK